MSGRWAQCPKIFRGLRIRLAVTVLTVVSCVAAIVPASPVAAAIGTSNPHHRIIVNEKPPIWRGHNKLRLSKGNLYRKLNPHNSTVLGEIETVAGNGDGENTGDGGSATSASIYDPQTVAVDPSGNVLIAGGSNLLEGSPQTAPGGNTIRLLAKSPSNPGYFCSPSCAGSSWVPGDIYTVAGNGTNSYSGDGGPALSAMLDQPSSITVDKSGNFIFTDMGNNRVRLVALGSSNPGYICSPSCTGSSWVPGYIYTIAGNGGQADSSIAIDYGFVARGLDSSAIDDSGNILVIDWEDSKVFVIAVSSTNPGYICSPLCSGPSWVPGNIYTVAGDGTYGYSGDGGPALQAAFQNQDGLTTDSDAFYNFFIADAGNARLRMVAVSLTNPGYICSPSCAGSAWVPGNIYTVAGTGRLAFGVTPSSGIPALDIPLASIGSISSDGQANILIPEFDAEVVYVLAVSSTNPGYLCSPSCSGSSWVPGNLYIVAGDGNGGFAGDGSSALSAELYSPYDVVSDSNHDLYIADSANNRIREVFGTNSPNTLPTINSVSPTFGPANGGTSVTLEGSNLSGATLVNFGTTPGIITSDSSSQITVTSPSGSGTVDITVTTSAGVSAISLADQFTYQSQSPPSISSISPTSGPSSGGTTVTIEGTNFTPSATVDFLGVPSTNVTYVSSTQLTAVSPQINLSSTSTGNVTVTTAGGVSGVSVADYFTYVVPNIPTVTSLSPNQGPYTGGTTVTIDGTNFTSTSSIDFYGQPATNVTYVSSTQLSALSPGVNISATSTVDITVTTSAGTSVTSPADYFTYVVPPPTVTSVSPNQGTSLGGTLITIMGTNFTSSAKVNLYGQFATNVTYVSSTELTADTPPASVTGNNYTVDVRVGTAAGSSVTSPADYFTYIQVPTPTESSGGSNPSQATSTCSAGDPVICSTGDFYDTTSDFTIPGKGLPLAFSRTYNSNEASVYGPLGYGWTDSYNMWLSSDLSGDITVHQENGSTVEFSPNGSGGYLAQPRVLAKLDQNSNGTFSFIRRDSQTFTFTAAGVLISESDLNGYVTTLTYNSSGQLSYVTDPEGRKLSFSYDSSGLISSISDPAARTVTFTYDSSGNLASVTDPTGAITTFTYDANHLMLTKSDPLDLTLTNTYDTSGRVIKQVDPMGRVTTWAYSGDDLSILGGTTTIDDPSGNVEVQKYLAGNIVSDTQGYGTSLAQTTTASYDPFTLEPTSITDPAGHTTTSTYDRNGNLLSQTDPLGRITTYTYNAFNELTSSTDPIGQTTTYTYDANGNLLSEAGPANTLGQRQVTSYAYANLTSPGQVTSVTDPMGNITTMAYDAYGDMTSSTNALGNTTKYTYNNIGERLSVTSAGGGITTYAYDQDGRQIAITNPLGDKSSSTYDADGNLISSTDANGNTTTYTYDADNETTSQTSANGSTITYHYDKNGNQTSVTDANGNTTTYTYNALNQKVSQTTPGGETTTYTYDANGNLISQKSPNGFTTSNTYNSDAELTSTSSSDPLVAPVSYTYDADGRKTSMTDGTGTSSYSYGPFGQESSTLTTPIAPAISSISPTYGGQGGGTSVTISGSGFNGVVGVDFGSTPAESFSENSQNTITALAPPGPVQSVDITVITDNGTSAITPNDKFTYLPTPTITSISPSGGPVLGGTKVEVTGTNLSSVSALSFGATKATSFTISSDTSISAISPPESAGVVDVTVTTLAGVSARSSADEFVYANLPTVTSISPNAGQQIGGDTITISGTNLSGASSVSFGSIFATSFSVVSPTEITTVDPPQAPSSVDVTVTTLGGTSPKTPNDLFSYEPEDHFCNLCLIDPATSGALSATGNSRIETNGIATIDSTSPDAIIATGSSQIKAQSVYLAGGVETTGTASLVSSSPPQSGSTPDPFGSFHLAKQGGSITSLSVTSSESKTGLPGIYSTIRASGNGSLSLEPGIYVITGSLTLSGSARLIGDGVTIYLACASYPSPCSTGQKGATINLSGNARMSIKAGYQGPGQGFTIWADPNNQTTITVTGSAMASLTGIFDVEGGDIQSVGGARVAISGGQLVADQAQVAGSGVISVEGPPPPASLPPAVTQLSPNNGYTFGDIQVTISGTNFIGTTSVDFGALSATSFSVISATQIEAIDPGEPPASVDVTVTTQQGTSQTSPQDLFTYNSPPPPPPSNLPPSVTGLSPNNGYVSGGTQVTISGTNFSGATSVDFGGTSATSFSVISPSEIEATNPGESVGSVDVTVTTPQGTSPTSGQDLFTYKPAPLSPSELCILCLLSSTSSGALSATGNATISASGTVTVDSTSTSAVIATGSSKITASAGYLGGGVETSGTALFNTGGPPLVGTTPDPFASYSLPTQSGLASSLSVGGSNSVTGQPGIYSTISVSGNGSMTLAPGIYVVTNQLSVTGSGKLSASGVTIYLGCSSYPSPCSSGENGASLSVSGSGEISLDGGAVGPGQGLVILADSKNVTSIDAQGSGALTVSGIVDASSGNVSSTGNATIAITSGGLVSGKAGATGSAKISVSPLGPGPLVISSKLVSRANSVSSKLVSPKHSASPNLPSREHVTSPKLESSTHSALGTQKVLPHADLAPQASSYSYNLDGELTSITYPNGESVTYTYNAIGQMTSTTDWQANKTNFSYNSNGDLISQSDPNSISVATTYNLADQMTSITDSSGSRTLASYNYTRNPLGLVSTASSQGISTTQASQSYSYSSVNQLISNNSQKYSYDPSGNMTTMATSSMTYNQSDQLTTSTLGGVTTNYSYDANGNRVSETNPSTATSFTYNGLNELTAFSSVPSNQSSSSTSASYTYYGNGLRASATTNGTTVHFAWNSGSGNDQLLSDGTNNYIYGPGSTPIEQINQTTQTPTYLYTDQLGSVVMQASQSGTVLGTESFSPYGSLASQSGTITTPFGFAGGYTDITGLIYLINRYYDPATGQFVSVDPLVGTTGEAYGYAGGDPVNAGDPLGLCGGPFTDFNTDGGPLGQAFAGTGGNPNLCVYTPLYNGLQSLGGVQSLSGISMLFLTGGVLETVWTQVYHRCSNNCGPFRTFTTHFWSQFKSWWDGSFGTKDGGSSATTVPTFTMNDGTPDGTLTWWVIMFRDWAAPRQSKGELGTFKEILQELLDAAVGLIRKPAHGLC